MAKLIILLSGPIAAGKSTLCASLSTRFSLQVVKTRTLIHKYFPNRRQLSRQQLQRKGEALDKVTGGTWVRNELATIEQGLPDDAVVLVDAVRIPGQVEAIRDSYGRRVVHIHLTAPEHVLEARYRDRHNPAVAEMGSYLETRKSSTEKRIDSLAEIADVVIDTSRSTADDVAVRAASHLGLGLRDYQRLVDVIVGGGYGSEGKGQIAAYMSPEYDLLVRVGGPNAGHTVYEEPAPYTFHHLPSGSRASKASLLIAPGAVVHVPTLIKEINDCNIEPSRLRIDPQAMVISEQDLKDEADLVRTIGSTGRGVGYATARKILYRGTDAGDRSVQLARDVQALRPYLHSAYDTLETAYREGHRILLEGTQGTALSIHHGFYPYVTSRDTTVAGCLSEAGISPTRVQHVIMVNRTYPIRVQDPSEEGATSGPMSQPLSWEEISRRSGLDLDELLQAEVTSTTGRQRRVAEFDWTLLKKAASLNAPTDIALTFVDYLSKSNRDARRFEQLSSPTINFIQEVERVAGARVSLISTRFHSRSIIDRRNW